VTRLFRPLTPEPAARLAWLRVATAATILLSSEVRDAPALAAVPGELRVAPEGLGWFVHHVPIEPTIATVAQAACVASALCALIGLAARRALVVLAISGFYVFALSQLSGAVWHDMHLLWMVALLVASPCDDALSYDHRGQPAAPDSVRYALPLFFARLLLACVYFFPGVHKLASSGVAWALSDNLRNQIWWKWAEHGTLPSFRIDHHPLLLHAGGLAILVFELSFPILALTRRGRPWAALGGLVFHALAQIILRIPFASLWLLYVVFVDPERVVLALRRRPRRAVEARDTPKAEPPSPFTQRGVRGVAVVGSTLFLGAFVQGIRGQMRAFPFACYPTFQWMASTTMPDLLLEAERPNGGRAWIPFARDSRGRRSQRQWGEIWSLSGVTSPVDPARLRAYFDSERRREPARTALGGASSARFYAASVSVVPEDRGQPPRPGRVLAEFILSAPAKGTKGSPLGGEGDAAGE
jgi:hypothetical protein